MGDVPVEALRVVGDPADAGAGRAVPWLTVAVLLVDRLDPVLQLVGELVAATREELDAVVGHRVVAGGEHHTEVGVEGPGEVGDRGRRQDADAQHVHPGAGQARHDGGLQELSGCPRITSDHGGRAMAREGACLGEYVRRSDRETERQLGRQIGVGDTPYSIRTEESSHWCPPKCSETTNHYCTANELRNQQRKRRKPTKRRAGRHCSGPARAWAQAEHGYSATGPMNVSCRYTPASVDKRTPRQHGVCRRGERDSRAGDT
ncbi:hypothetical protein SBADM41S_10722 [Streptomyces badius]